MIYSHIYMTTMHAYLFDLLAKKNIYIYLIITTWKNINKIFISVNEIKIAKKKVFMKKSMTRM